MQCFLLKKKTKKHDKQVNVISSQIVRQTDNFTPFIYNIWNFTGIPKIFPIETRSVFIK